MTRKKSIRRPRFWTEWAEYSNHCDRAVIVYQHNRLFHARKNRDNHATHHRSGWPSENLWYYIKGVRYWVTIHWYGVTCSIADESNNSSIKYLPINQIPSNVLRVVRKVQSVLCENLTDEDRQRRLEEEAFEKKFLEIRERITKSFQ